MEGLARATSIDELLQKQSKMMTPEGLAYADGFEARPDDIIINTYAKAGTTWMQQIVHGLRTGGDMDFSEITEVVPWIQFAGDLGLDLSADHRGAPRAFKSHENWEDTPHNCRYIYIVRDPADSALSFYNFMNGWFLEPGAVELDKFIQEFYLQRGFKRGYWSHLLSWWPQHDNPNALFLCYENMKGDLGDTVKRVAEFMGITDSHNIEIATRQASFEFMNANNRHFDDHLITEARNVACGLPADAISSKVKSGKTGGGRQTLSAETRNMLDQRWRETVGEELGFASYQDLRATLTPSAQT